MDLITPMARAFRIAADARGVKPLIRLAGVRYTNALMGGG